MGQKVNPTGFRVGITEDWKSKWYAPKAAFGSFLVEDQKIRRYIDDKLNRRPPFAAVSDIMIERTREEVTITLRTARPGLVIGPKGAEVDKLREELEDMIKRFQPKDRGKAYPINKRTSHLVVTIEQREDGEKAAAPFKSVGARHGKARQ